MFKPINDEDSLTLSLAKNLATEHGHILLPFIRTMGGYFAFCNNCGLKLTVDLENSAAEFSQLANTSCDKSIENMLVGDIQRNYEILKTRKDYDDLDDALVFMGMLEKLRKEGHEFSLFVRVNADVNDLIYLGFCNKCGRCAVARSNKDASESPVGGDAMVKPCGMSFIEEIIGNTVRDSLKGAVEQAKYINEMKKRLKKGGLTFDDMNLFANTEARCETCETRLGPHSEDENHHCTVDTEGGIHHYCAAHCTRCNGEKNEKADRENED